MRPKKGGFFSGKRRRDFSLRNLLSSEPWSSSQASTAASAALRAEAHGEALRLCREPWLKDPVDWMGRNRFAKLDEFSTKRFGSKDKNMGFVLLLAGNRPACRPEAVRYSLKCFAPEHNQSEVDGLQAKDM